MPAYLRLSILAFLAVVPFAFLLFSAFKPYAELINSQANWTLPLLLTGLRSIYLTRYDMLVSGSLLTVIPVLIAYAFAQRTFVRGAQTSGLKG